MAVTITAPDTTPITLPFSASANAISTAGNIEAAWYQIDDGDAINANFMPSPASTVTISFTLDGLGAGEHTLSVSARNATEASYSDQSFTVSAPPPPP